MSVSFARLVPRPDDRARLTASLGDRWRPAEAHPLATLQGKGIGLGRLVVFLGPRNQVGAEYFQLFVRDDQGRLSQGPLALGLSNRGRYPAYNWIELVRYLPVLRFDGEEVSLKEGGRQERLFRLLGELVPPGGSLMVEYDSPDHADTAAILGRGYPPPCSPLGYALLVAGCLSYRDWYIPEGGREGPRKLQGYKPLDDEAARGRAEALAEALSQALSRPPGRRAEGRDSEARRWGRRALALLRRRFPFLDAPERRGLT